MSHGMQKKIAVINDFTGFGRCSLTVSIPVISHMKVQCCPVPTSIFSNHTGFPSYYFDDYTMRMEDYIRQWKKLNLHFDGISSGFLGSLTQIQIVQDFIHDFREAGTKVIVDPVMGDNGKAYATYTPQMCAQMKSLASCADILTPNLTECCLLTDTPFQSGPWHRDDLFDLAERLSRSGAEKVVITGISMGQFIGNVVYEKGMEPTIVRRKRIGHERSGTGDIFASIISADCVNGVPFIDSVKKATAFIQRCIEATEAYEVPKTDGVCFEEVLNELKA